MLNCEPEKFLILEAIENAPTPAGIGASRTERAYSAFIRPHVVGSFPSVPTALKPVS
jgi:hypothetical protein